AGWADQLNADRQAVDAACGDRDRGQAQHAPGAGQRQQGRANVDRLTCDAPLAAAERWGRQRDRRQGEEVDPAEDLHHGFADAVATFECADVLPVVDVAAGEEPIAYFIAVQLGFGGEPVDVHRVGLPALDDAVRLAQVADLWER